MNEYTFKQIKANPQLFKGISGIYAIKYQNEIIYIGQSRNIRKRILSHMRIDSWIKKNETDSFLSKEFKELNQQKYDFFKLHYDELTVSINPLPIEELNDRECEAILKHTPKFNYAGIKTEYKPVLPRK